MDRTASRDLRATSSMSTGISAQIRDAKGLALELKSIIKRREPWDRDLEFQRESLRKAYLRIIFSPALFQPGATALQHRGSSTADALSTTALKARSSTLGPTPSSSSSAAARQQLDILNLLWLDTSHALIQSYRSRLATLDKQLASAPKAHKGANTNKARAQHGNGGDVQSAAVGPVARRKLVHAFRQFLSREDDFWRTLCGRLASRLTPEEALELRAVGIVQSDFLSASDGFGGGGGGERGDAFGPAAVGGAADRATAQADLSDDERRVRRAAVLPLAHKALICYGDLARYAELYNEASVPAAVAAGGHGDGARREGGRRGGKGGGGAAAAAAAAADKRVKTYSKAAECYNQARMLLPDNGNPSNQLAVLAQYCADPLSSIYHYYRALSVRTPFSTARANLQITFAKAVARWFSSDGGEPEGDEGVKFRAAFVVLQGILYTKDTLSELPTLSLRVDDLFRTVLIDRIFTSDVVTKIVVTALSALWDARISRSSAAGQSTTTLSRTKTGSAAPQQLATATTSAPPGQAAPAPRVNLEPEALVHLLSLFTLLLRTSATETVELFSANLAAATTAAPPTPANPAQNISAVLRRALPALRILTKWLVAQLDYVERVTQRLEAAERKRVARARARGRPSTGTGTMGLGGSGGTADEGEGEQHEAQQPLSLDSSGSRGSGATPGAAAGRVSLAELEAALDALWTAYADYANSIKLAFPSAALDGAKALLANGGWLEEDVELLGFAPLRRAMRPADGEVVDTAGARIRRVGRDVHPNDEQLMRIFEGQQDALLLADSSLTRMSLVDGAFVFTPREQPGEDTSFDRPEPAAAVAPRDDEADEDEEMLDQVTEDDPVDRAMRIDAADKLDMDGLSDLDDDLDDDDDDDEEQIVYPGSGSRSSPQPNPNRPAPSASRPSSHFSTPSASPARAPVDLRQQLFHGNVPPQHHPHAPAVAAPALSPSPTFTGATAAGPSLLGPAPGGSPSLNSTHSIWSTAPGLGGSPLLPPTSTIGALPPPSAYALPQQQQQQPVTPRSFESIPNLTHGSPAAQLAGWPSGASGAQHGALPPPAASGAALYGGAFAAPLAHSAMQGGGAPSHYSHPHQPPPSSSSRPPGFPTAFTGSAQPQPQQQQQQWAAPSGLSPFASPFGQAPPPPQGQGGGWPSEYS